MNHLKSIYGQTKLMKLTGYTVRHSFPLRRSSLARGTCTRTTYKHNHTYTVTQLLIENLKTMTSSHSATTGCRYQSRYIYMTMHASSLHEQCILCINVGHKMFFDSIHHVLSLLLRHVAEKRVCLQMVSHTLNKTKKQ